MAFVSTPPNFEDEKVKLFDNLNSESITEESKQFLSENNHREVIENKIDDHIELFKNSILKEKIPADDGSYVLSDERVQKIQNAFDM